MQRYGICFLAGSLLLLSACTGRTDKPAAAQSGVRPVHFRNAMPPVGLASEHLSEWMRDHYWDRFDFADTLLPARADTLEMLRAFAVYVDRYVVPGDRTAIDSLMRRASVSGAMLRYFAMLGSRVLYDPNSPLRNDELYMAVLEAELSSPWLDSIEKVAPRYELEMALRNRVGSRANDFRYTLADGTTRRMYDLKADYLLLFINNPGCDMCRQLREELEASPMVRSRIERGELCVLALCPDADLTEWKANRDRIPASWINAYDKDTRLLQDSLYDLRAVPSLYLLDRDKRVLVKDASDVGAIEWALDHDAR